MLPAYPRRLTYILIVYMQFSSMQFPCQSESVYFRQHPRAYCLFFGHIVIKKWTLGHSHQPSALIHRQSFISNQLHMVWILAEVGTWLWTCGEVRNADRMNQHGMRVLPRSESPWGNLTPQNLASEEGCHLYSSGGSVYCLDRISSNIIEYN